MAPALGDHHPIGGTTTWLNCCPTCSSVGYSGACVSYLRRMIEALKLASPIFLASRFEDGLGHCLEASIGGVGALYRRGIAARVLPCAVVVRSVEAGRCWSAGLSPSQIYSLLPSPKPAFEEFRRARLGSGFDDDHPLHVVIEAKHEGERAIIDLTIGQLRLGGAPCLLYTSPSPRDGLLSRMPSSA